MQLTFFWDCLCWKTQTGNQIKVEEKNEGKIRKEEGSEVIE